MNRDETIKEIERLDTEAYEANREGDKIKAQLLWGQMNDLEMMLDDFDDFCGAGL